MLSHEEGKIPLAHEHQLEPGDQIMQQKLVGHHKEVFQQIAKLWEPMWNRHKDTPSSRWEPVIHRLEACGRSPDHELECAPITVDEWLAATRAKKPPTAGGPDGVSRTDLLRMPHHLVQTLVDQVDQQR